MSLKSGKKWVTWYKFEQSDWFGINYHIGILVYREDSSSSSDEEVIVIMQSENPSRESEETTQDNQANHSDSNNQQNEMQSEHDELTSVPLQTIVDQNQNDSLESDLRLDKEESRRITSQSNNQSRSDKRSTHIRQQPSRLTYFAPGQPSVMQTVAENMQFGIPVCGPQYCWPIPQTVIYPPSLRFDRPIFVMGQ